jgi:hypothetical protein
VDLTAITDLLTLVAAGAVTIGVAKLGVMGTIMAYKWISAAVK